MAITIPVEEGGGGGEDDGNVVVVSSGKEYDDEDDDDEMSGGICRLLCHRLTGTGVTVASFVAQELVRLAESRAVFSLLVRSSSNDGNDTTINRPVEWNTRKKRGGLVPLSSSSSSSSSSSLEDDFYLLLHLVSWDSRMATSTNHHRVRTRDREGNITVDSKTQSTNSNNLDPVLKVQKKRSMDDTRPTTTLDRKNDEAFDEELLNFHRVAKVVFERKKKRHYNPDTGTMRNGQEENDSADPLQWKWDKLDFCCPPSQGRYGSSNNNNNKTKESSTSDDNAMISQMVLPRHEVDELYQILQDNSSHWSAGVVELTIQLKLGFLKTSTVGNNADGDPKGIVRMSALPL